MTLIIICLVLMAIAFIFFRDSTRDLIGFLLSLIFWGFVIAFLGFILLVFIMA